MKFNSKYSVVIVISLLLIVLSTITTTINYIVSKNNTQKQLKTQSLPLSLDNVYTEIQKHIIQPYLVSSMMANDTFVQDWLLNDEENVDKIKHYLSTIKNKYEMFTTFLVSEGTRNYYTHDGFIEVIDENKADNKWYFSFKNQESKDEINLDHNKKLSDSLIMFINYKILNREYRYLGATGVGIKLSYIDDLLTMFKEKYKFNVIFFDPEGKVVLSKNSIENRLSDYKHFEGYKDKILSKYAHYFEITKDEETYLINTKYIPELNLYLLVEAKLSDFIKQARDVYFFNLFISISIAILITFIIIFIIKKYNNKLEYLANFDQLTNLNNRRSFTERLNFLLLLNGRKSQKISLAFIDIDNFKTINDNYGHDIGDKVLVKIANIMKNSVRETDLVSRWGGEEFVIALINSDKENSKQILEKIMKKLYDDAEINSLVNNPVTMSIGLTMYKDNENFDLLVNRADDAMYKAKRGGKNRIITE